MKNNFILFSRPRCGTHMLRTALCQHMDVHCATELLNVYMMIPQRFACVTLDETVKHIQEKTPTKVHGYVLHDDQFHYPERRSIPVSKNEWNDIPRDTKIIRLNRDNELERLVSECRARRSNRWSVYKSINPDKYHTYHDDLPFRLEFNDLMHWYRLHKLAAEATSRFLGNFTNILHVWYEDLIDNWKMDINGIFSFLNVRQYQGEIRPKTTKTGLPLRKTISNYGELRELCVNTELEQYFKK